MSFIADRIDLDLRTQAFVDGAATWINVST